jgi:hypothetical protein
MSAQAVELHLSDLLTSTDTSSGVQLSRRPKIPRQVFDEQFQTFARIRLGVILYFCVGCVCAWVALHLHP